MTDTSNDQRTAALDLLTLRTAQLDGATDRYDRAILLARNTGASWRQLGIAAGRPARTIRDHYHRAIARGATPTDAETRATS